MLKANLPKSSIHIISKYFVWLYEVKDTDSNFLYLQKEKLIEGFSCCISVILSSLFHHVYNFIIFHFNHVWSPLSLLAPSL